VARDAARMNEEAVRGRPLLARSREPERPNPRAACMPESTHAQTLLGLRAAQTGDREAVEHLFARHSDRLLEVVSLLLARRRAELLEDDVDIVQESLLDALQHRGDFEPRSEGGLLSSTRGFQADPRGLGVAVTVAERDGELARRALVRRSRRAMSVDERTVRRGG